MSVVLYNVNWSCNEFNHGDKVYNVLYGGDTALLIKHLDAYGNDEYQFIITQNAKELCLIFRYKGQAGKWVDIQSKTPTIAGEVFNINYLLPSVLDVRKLLIDAIKTPPAGINVTAEMNEISRLSLRLQKFTDNCLNRMINHWDLIICRSSPDGYCNYLKTTKDCKYALELQMEIHKTSLGALKLLWVLKFGKLELQDNDLNNSRVKSDGVSVDVEMTENMRLDCQYIVSFDVDKLIKMDANSKKEVLRNLLSQCVKSKWYQVIFLAKCLGILLIILSICLLCMYYFFPFDDD
jgi:hypothetical protein